MSDKAIAASLAVTALLVLLAHISCSPGLPPSETSGLAASQIREYHGEKLSSFSDFHENSIKGPQQVDMQSYGLTVNGLVENIKTYSYNEVLVSYKPYSKLVTLDCVEGWSVKILWEGVLVRELLEASGILPTATTVIFSACDNYSTSLPLKYILDRDILLAYKINGVTLPPARGFPFQLVAEDKWGYKWIKWVTGIKLSSDEKYRGYWESAGYSNQGDTDKPFIER